MDIRLQAEKALFDAFLLKLSLVPTPYPSAIYCQGSDGHIRNEKGLGDGRIVGSRWC